MNLNLGCGNDYRAGFINIDLGGKCDLKLDLDREKLPYEDESVDFIIAYHLVEHLHNFIPFMNECHRVLKKDCRIELTTPSPLCEYFWQDPTHVRGYTLNTFKIYFIQPTENYGIDLWSKVIFKQDKMIINDVEAIILNITLIK